MVVTVDRELEGEQTMAFFGKQDGAGPEEARRLRMVSSQIEARGVKDPAVLEAMRRVPRHLFVPPEMAKQAYHDGPLAIGEEQTISQPYIVALMTEELRPTPGMKILEIGTGSGYQAAILAACGCDIYSVEILRGLGLQAAERLRGLGYGNVQTMIGDGYDGWREEAPFGGIVVTAAPPRIPQPLLEQLAPGGRLVIPIGRAGQELVTITRTAEGHERRPVTPVRFVPMTGKADKS
jgi:protein-L-isoaspartate(D-aspartate) O-methyltransferase